MEQHELAAPAGELVVRGVRQRAAGADTADVGRGAADRPAHPHPGTHARRDADGDGDARAGANHAAEAGPDPCRLTVLGAVRRRSGLIDRPVDPDVDVALTFRGHGAPG